MVHHSNTLLLVLWTAYGVSVQAEEPGEGAFAPCEPLSSCEKYLCLYGVGSAAGYHHLDEAVERLDRDWEAGKDKACYLAKLGYLEYLRKNDRTVEILSGAAEIYRQTDSTSNLSWAWRTIGAYLRTKGRLAEARPAFDKALEAAVQSGETDSVVNTRLEIAILQEKTGRELSQALSTLREIESAVCARDTSECQRTLESVGRLQSLLGNDVEATRTFERLASLSERRGDTYSESIARLSRLMTSHAWPMLPVQREELVKGMPAELQKILAMAITAGNREVEARVYLLQGHLASGVDAEKYYQQCIDVDGLPVIASECRQALAASVAPHNAGLAERLLLESEQAVLSTEEPMALVYGARFRIEAYQELYPAETTLAQSEEILSNVEMLRALQSDPTYRASFFSAWADLFYQLSGRLLASSMESSQRLSHAFEITERLRARNLLDVLEKAEIAPDLPQEWLEIQRSILEKKRQLLDPRTTPEEAADALGALRQSEAEREELARVLDKEFTSHAVLHGHDFASIADVQQQLQDEEAVLSFQVADWEDFYGDFAGGSWLLAITRNNARAYRLPGREALDLAIKNFHGLDEQRSESSAELHKNTAVHLYEEILGQAIEQMPATVGNLIIIPDGALHMLPFAALRSERDAPPLAERFQLSAVPSATLWLRWRQNRTAGGSVPALAVAVPQAPSLGESNDADSGAPLRSAVLSLPALPNAAAEAQSVAEFLGEDSVIRVGKDASESSFKEERLGRFTFLHFATHAVMNADPYESAIGLDDGWLLFQEIAALDLDGQIVVLSACDTASGTLFRGEGVLSLGRAFFQAGARTVIGSLWPVQDDHAAIFFRQFYYWIAQGLGISEAVQATQRKLIQAGYPTSAWAGFVVLGDGAYVPFPGGRPRPFWNAGTIAAAGLALAVVLLLLGGRAYRRRTRPWTEIPV